MSPRPKILDELGSELVRAARADEARELEVRGLRRLLRRTPRTFFLGVFGLLGLAAVATAATLIIGRGDPIPAASANDVPLELRPVAGSARLNGLDVPDPDGGPAWDVRTSRSRTGAICTTVGQVLDGELGLVGLDRRFRALPAGAADTCSTPQRRGATLAGARAFRGGGSLSPLTVVNGVAAPGVRRVVVVAGGQTVVPKLGPGHAFLAVFRGVPEEVRPRIVLAAGAGQRTTLRLADEGEFIVADPSGGAPWALQYRPAARGLRCVAARRERGADSPLRTTVLAFSLFTAATPARCARPEGGVVAARFVPSRALRGGPPWGVNPARTIAWGIAPAGVRTVTISGAGAPRRVSVDPRGHGFVAVFDGRVDPRRLRITARGRQLGPALGRKGQALVRKPPPAWRSVAAAIAGPGPSFLPPVPPLVAGSIAIVRRAADPTGGPAWALRSWRLSPPRPVVSSVPGIKSTRGTVSGRGARGMLSRALTCFAVGIERGGRFVEPRAGGYRAAQPSPLGGGCTTQAAPGKAQSPLVRTYVDDPDATTPQPERVVVAGVLGAGVRSAQLLGSGAPRELDLGRDGSYLLVLGPEHAGAPLEVRVVRDDGSILTSERSLFAGNCKGGVDRAMRVADPDGRQPWTSGVGVITGRPRGSGNACQYVSRLAGDRLATVPDGETWMYYGAGFASGTGFALGPDHSITLDVQSGPMGPALEGPASPPSPAQVARRTLPGRTVLTGRVNDNVVTVTLRTPRDIRTLRVAPGGAFIAVYDGVFYGGAITATARLRDGREVTIRRPASLL